MACIQVRLAIIDQWAENPERNPYINGQLIYDKGTNPFNKERAVCLQQMVLETWISMYFTAYININST